MCMPLLPLMFWQIFSIMTLVSFLILTAVYYARSSKFPVDILLSIGAILLGALAIWVKSSHDVAHYRQEMLLDVLIVVAMLGVVIDFITLTAQACSIAVSPTFERRSWVVVSLAGIAAAIYFYHLAAPQQVESFTAMVNSLLQPIWLLVLIIIIVRLSRHTK